MSLHRSVLRVLCVLVFTMFPLRIARAQDAVNLDSFRSTVLPGDGFGVSRPNDLGHGRFATQFQLDYGHNPLVADVAGDRFSIVDHHLVGTLSLAVGLWDHLVLFGQLPASFVMTGDNARADSRGFPSADGTRLGDPIFGVRVRLFGDRSDVFALALQAAVSLPLGRALTENLELAGESGYVFLPSIIGELRFLADENFRSGRIRLAANLGARVRDATRNLNSLNIEHEFTYGVGLTINPIPSLDLMVEAYGATSFEDVGNVRESPFELIGGMRGRPGAGFTLGVAGGASPVSGYGSPDARVIGTLGWEITEPQPVTTVVAVVEVPLDRDNDGIADGDDRCPIDPEDRDAFQDDDGCPDADNDGDGIVDSADSCPLVAEDMDGFADADGCTDPDNDNDGILDANDRCPGDAEDRDGFADDDGCPEADNDGDGIADANDQCPTAPGPAPEGCPRTVRLEDGRITILERIEFQTNRATLLASATPILEEIRGVLAANPQIRRISVDGHTDDRGPDARNLRLSQERAASVVDWLIAHGVDAARLEPHGFGEANPIAPNSTNAGRQQNRRVEFNIIDPRPTVPAPGANAD